ncbi:MAG: DNA-3-methyladenine glycosylase 2 family protein [Ignavibacteria bacterium]|jgi:DNA-3-methyladenine glycosylase II
MVNKFYKKEISKAINHLSKNDEKLSIIINKLPRCNLRPRRKYFNAIVNSIIGQQLSLASARAIRNKFYAHFENQITAEKVLQTKDQTLKTLGLSNAKVIYIKDFSSKIINKEISLKNISAKSEQEIIDELTKVKGIGVWTTHMFLMFTLARINVLPVGDLGIKKAIMLNYGFKKMPSEEQVYKISKKNNWHPYNSIASWYLWKALDMEPESL